MSDKDKEIINDLDIVMDYINENIPAPIRLPLICKVGRAQQALRLQNELLKETLRRLKESE